MHQTNKTKTYRVDGFPGVLLGLDSLQLLDPFRQRLGALGWVHRRRRLLLLLLLLALLTLVASGGSGEDGFDLLLGLRLLLSPLLGLLRKRKTVQAGQGL